MNGTTLLAAYLLVGLGLTLTTAPPGASTGMRVAMVPGWLPLIVVAVIVYVVDGEDA